MYKTDDLILRREGQRKIRKNRFLVDEETRNEFSSCRNSLFGIKNVSTMALMKKIIIKLMIIK